MEKVPYSKYTKEFSLSAVRLVTEAGVSGVSASGFHASRSRGSSRRVQEDGRLEIAGPPLIGARGKPRP